MRASERYEETITLPGAVRFPVELIPPDGFDPERPESWPEVDGRLEWVGGRLFYMPPCGERQQEVVADVVFTLMTWARSHAEFVVGSNDAGMHLGKDTRGADAAVWRRATVGAPGPGFRTVPPVLAVEVAGRDEGLGRLRRKARWYLDAGVAVVWIVLPEKREVVVLTAAGESAHREGDLLPQPADLVGLTPDPREFFRQLSSAGAP